MLLSKEELIEAIDYLSASQKRLVAHINIIVMEETERVYCKAELKCSQDQIAFIKNIVESRVKDAAVSDISIIAKELYHALKALQNSASHDSSNVWSIGPLAGPNTSDGQGGKISMMNRVIEAYESKFKEDK